METTVKIAPIAMFSPRLVCSPNSGKTAICVAVATRKPMAVDVQASISESRRLCIAADYHPALMARAVPMPTLAPMNSPSTSELTAP